MYWKAPRVHLEDGIFQPALMVQLLYNGLPVSVYILCISCFASFGLSFVPYPIYWVAAGSL